MIWSEVFNNFTLLFQIVVNLDWRDMSKRALEFTLSKIAVYFVKNNKIRFY